MLRKGFTMCREDRQVWLVLQVTAQLTGNVKLDPMEGGAGVGR